MDYVFSTDVKLHHLQEIDYDRYALAEEYLGWFNSTTVARSDDFVDFNAVTAKIMSSILSDMKSAKSEIAHLKVYAVANEDYYKASLTSSDDDITDHDIFFNHKMMTACKNATIIINARVNIDPEQLKCSMLKNLDSVFQDSGIQYENLKIESFKPGRPSPHYRM